MPSPLDRGNIKAHDLDTDQDIILSPSDDAPLAALAFKIMSDPYVGRLTFIRIYSGTLVKGMTLLNTTKGVKKEFPVWWKCMLISVWKKMNSMRAILRLAWGLKSATTGDTLCAHGPGNPLGKNGIP